VFENKNDYDLIKENDKINFPEIKKLLKNNEPIKAKINNKEIILKAELSEKDKEVIFSGSKLLYVRDKIK